MERYQTSAKMTRILEEIGAETGLGSEEVLRRAMATYRFVNEETSHEGRRLVITDEKYKILKEIEFS